MNTRTYSRYTKEASFILGKQIQVGRKSRRLSERDFADRVGIARATLQKIERGDLKCEIGIVFEAALLAGVKLFEIDSPPSLNAAVEGFNDKLALLPKRIRKPTTRLNEDF